MSKASSSLVASVDNSKVGPDYFRYYACEVDQLLSQDDDVFPFTSEALGTSCNGAGSLFDNGPGARLSDFKKERLKILLRQAVVTLTPEVEEMLDPVVSMHRLKSRVRSKHAGSDGDAAQVAQKKFKMSSSPSSTSIYAHPSPVNWKSSGEGSGPKCTDSKFSDMALAKNGISNSVQRNCEHCHTTQWRSDPWGKSLCNACSANSKRKMEDQPDSNVGADKENEEVEKDLQFLLQNDPILVEETIKKYSDELSAALEHMEKQLEELLNAALSKWRPMSHAEKHRLRNLIQDLPPQNLDRVVEMVKHGKPAEAQHCDEILVNLEKEDNVTLWRLYYYVEAVKKARKLAC